MTFHEQRLEFDKNAKFYEAVKLKFIGVDGFDVYNPSIPFEWNGKWYIYGRVEYRHEWARSWVRLFEQTGKDEWTLVPNSMIYALEDPYIAKVGDELIMGGTHVRNRKGKTETYYGYFFRGTDLENMYYFTTGPDFMKDIRVVELKDGKVGVFSRPRCDDVIEKYGSESVVGFDIIDSIDELSDDVVENAPVIPGLFGEGEWGGCNQCYLLDSGMIGIIGHKCYHGDVNVYTTISFVFDPYKREVHDFKIIATRGHFPDGPTKVENTSDTTFPTGIVMRDDGKVDFYTGLNDVEVGRAVIDYPFEGYGKIVTKK